MQPERERWLIGQLNKNPDAFHELYGAYFQRVYGYVAFRIDNRQDVEDTVSEIFLHVVRKLGQFKNQHDYSFAAWLFTITRNAIHDFYRARDREAVPLEQIGQSAIDTPPPETDLELRRLINTLPERRREVITLKFFSGLRNNEIAVVLGLDERTVASHLSRGLKDLQQKYLEVQNSNG
jgi:RNA polymerase sigma-70 factor, ECF subfamily